MSILTLHHREAPCEFHMPSNNHREDLVPTALNLAYN